MPISGAHFGHVNLAEGFLWLGSPVAMAALGLATALEIGAYYIPWLDNLLDSITTPAAIVAGTMLTASMMADMSPFLQWSLAAVAGGGVAGTVQASTVVLRGASSAATGGLANPIVSSGELAASAGVTGLAIIIPPLCILFLLIATYVLWSRSRKKQKFALSSGK